MLRALNSFHLLSQNFVGALLRPRLGMGVAVSFAALSFIFASPSTEAATSLNPGDLSRMTSGAANEIIKMVVIGADHRSLRPASSLGLAIGIDLGITVTAVPITGDMREALALAGVSGRIPAVIPIPRVTVHKGLPLGIDLGLSYSGFQTNRLMAFEGQWSFLPEKKAVSLAVRGSFQSAKLYFIKARTTKVDLVASRELLVGVFEPYFGIGAQFGNGDLNVSAGGQYGVPVNVNTHQEINTGHSYIGLPVNIGLGRVTLEADYAWIGYATYSAKYSWVF